MLYALSAVLQPRLARVFTAAGVTIAEGWVNRNIPVITVSDFEIKSKNWLCWKTN